MRGRFAPLPSPLPPRSGFFLAVAAACTDVEPPVDDSAGDDSAVASVECPPTTVTMTRTWTKDELPARSEVEHTEPGVALGDLDGDGDGDLDAFIAWGGGSFVLANDGTGALTLDENFTVDGGPMPDGAAVALADLDGDGDLDAWLGQDRGQTSSFLWNDGHGSFSLTPSSAPNDTAATGAFADADGDGDLDLAVAILLPDVDPQSVLDGTQTGVGNQLWLQGEPGDWSTGVALPAAQNTSLTCHAAWLDVELDGDLDLYLGNVWGAVLVPNQLLLNDGAAQLTTAPACGCDKPMNSMGVAMGDADDDGFPDLYVTDIGSPTLFRNDGAGGFYDATLASGARIPPSDTNLSSWATTFGDLDQDGCSDLLTIFGRLAEDAQVELDFAAPEGEVWNDPDLQTNVWLRGDCLGNFVRVDGTDLDTVLLRDRSVAIGDLDADGSPDFVTVGKHDVHQWRVDGGCGPGITLRLHGSSGNADGFGARVRTHVNGRIGTQWMLPSTTHGSNALELYLGLGGAARADKVSVEWADGTTSTYTDVPARTTLHATR